MTNLKPKRMGTCYVDVYRYFCYEDDLPGTTMVHGILHGRGDLEGWTYGHAWIEMGDVAFQPIKQGGGRTYGLAIIDRKENFYKRYNVDESKLVRYTKKEAMALGLKYGHFGPWHDLGLGPTGYRYEGGDEK